MNDRKPEEKGMNILITGAQGFIGKNLLLALDNIKKGKDKTYSGIGIGEVYAYDLDTDPNLLKVYCEKADFVFNLAGVNRPKEQTEFMEGNFGFVSTLLDTLKNSDNQCPVMLASSTQAVLDNPYGQSKKAGEDLFQKYAEETGAKVLIYRFPNVFGKWCRPNYNSAIATFCHNIARDLPITVNDRSVELNLVYVDDVVTELIQAMQGKENRQDNGVCSVPTVHATSLGRIVDLLYAFKESRKDLSVPFFSDPFISKLYATYLSYLPTDRFGYDLKMNTDERGSFTEFIRTPDRGQLSVNISKPGIVKGQHWHHTKNEKFLVVYGQGVIRFRNMMPDTVQDVIEYFVSGEQLQVIDIPTGYTHNIENLGETDMVTVMWASEPFDAHRPDTYFEPV